MDPWDILGIEVDADKKAIKTAYARLLKKTRPDDDPEGFTRLHDAYQSALKQLAYNTAPSASYTDWAPADKNNSETPLSDPVNIEEVMELEAPNKTDDSFTYTESIETLNNNFTEDIEQTEEVLEPVIDNFQQDWNALFKQVDDLINSPSDDRKLLQNWQSIETIPSLSDLEFKSNTSDELFELIALANLDAEDESLPPPIPIIVLDYLSELFSWEEKWIQYQKKFDDTLLDAVYPYISYIELVTADNSPVPEYKKNTLHLFDRTFAFLIDTAIAFSLPALFFGIAGIQYNDTVVISGAALYFLITIPLLEASHWQASFGKKIMGLQIVTKQGNRLGYAHAFWRGFIASISIIGMKVIVWAHLFTVYKYNLLFHDSFSSSYVIKKNKQD